MGKSKLKLITYDLYDDDYYEPKKSKKEKVAAAEKKFEKVVSRLTGETFDSNYKKKKKKSFSGPWDDYDYDENYASQLPDVIPDSIPETFENSLTANQRNIRKGNVPYWMLLDPHKDGGFHFGKQKYSQSDYYVGKPQDKDGNILTAGGPGSHKTSGTVTPNFVTWRGHIVVVDVKPESDLLAQCKKMSKPLGKTTLVFNPYKADSCRFDPFAFIRADGKNNLARNAKELAVNLISTILGDINPVWIKSAQNLLAGIIVYYVGENATFSETMKDIQLLDVDDLIAAIQGSDNETAKMFVSKLKNLKQETLAGVGMDFTDLAILAADPLMQSILSPAENSITIDWNCLNTAKNPMNIVLQIPEVNLDVWKPMIKLLINQLIRTLQRRPDKYSNQEYNLTPVLIILDEFSSYGEISSIKNGLATLRSRGVTFDLVIQSLAQLENIYNPVGMREILDLCIYKAILNVPDPTSQRYFSEMIGSVVVQIGELAQHINQKRMK